MVTVNIKNINRSHQMDLSMIMKELARFAIWWEWRYQTLLIRQKKHDSERKSVYVPG